MFAIEFPDFRECVAERARLVPPYAHKYHQGVNHFSKITKYAHVREEAINGA